MYLQNTYIKGNFLACVILYRHGASKAVLKRVLQEFVLT